MQYLINNITVDNAPTYADACEIAKHAEQYGATHAVAEVDGDFMNVTFYSRAQSQPFERIRRITGYLVGTLDRFNNGKRAEEHDRVKHAVL